MNGDQARRVLLPYRPGTGDERDPKFAEALELVRGDSELSKWFEEHCAFQRAMRTKLQQIAVPAELRDRILACQTALKIIQPRVWWRKPAAWAAAAALVALGTVLALVSFRPDVPDQFADFRSRMVRTALREYRMDIVTNDLQQVRQFLSNHGAPADYPVPAGLQRLKLTGAGLLKWRSQPVSMVCFDRGDREMLFLFVLDRDAVKNAPPAAPEMAHVNGLITVSWSEGRRAYMLAGPEESGFREKYL